MVSRAQAFAALENGMWVFEWTPFGTNADALTESRYEIFDDWSSSKRPRLGAIHRNDRTGGFSVGMSVRVGPHATSRQWVAGSERVVRHPAAGHDGVVRGHDEDGEIDAIVHVEFVDGTSSSLPGSWLTRHRV